MLQRLHSTHPTLALPAPSTIFHIHARQRAKKRAASLMERGTGMTKGAAQLANANAPDSY